MSDKETVATQQVEQVAAESFREELSGDAPSENERAELLREHAHHLVRDTTSLVSDKEEVMPGMEVDKEAEVPDTYCFSCGEWIGLSGVDLTGTPRSKSDAYYLGGPPDGVRDARECATDAVADAAGDVLELHPEIETAEAAVKFVLDSAEATEFTEAADGE